MGPIERELRARAEVGNFRMDQSCWLSYEAFKILIGAERNLGVVGPVHYSGRTDDAQRELDALWPDIYSEAIEAASELKL